MQVGDLVKRTFTNILYADKHAVGVIVDSQIAGGTANMWFHSVLWSDGRQFQHWARELELISASR